MGNIVKGKKTKGKKGTEVVGGRCGLTGLAKTILDPSSPQSASITRITFA